MKNFRKVIALIFAAVMVLAMSVPAFAEGEGTTTGYTVTVNNATSGESYTIYKVFDATTASGRTDGGTGISYTSTWLTESNDYFNVESKGNITIKDAGKKSDGTLSDAAIAWLKSQVSSFTAGATKTASGTSVVFDGLSDGYYYVTTTTGSFVSVDSIAPNVIIQDKNTVPSGDKKQSASASNYADTKLNLNVGDTVYYEYTITNGKGTDKVIELTDTMSNGLTFNQNSIVVKKGGTALTENTEYTVENKSATGFKLTLTADYVKTLSENDTVVVTYTATVNSNAVVDNATGNSNTATLKYSNQTSTDVVYVATYDFVVKKTDGTNFLDGAEFKLYDAVTGGNQILLSSDSTGMYKDPNGSADTKIDINSANGVNVRGLAPGTYYLEEVVTPAGYNQLTARQSVTITADGTAAVDVTVVNNAGTELPTTGGIGTTIFYIVGAILVVGAGIVLISRRRMNDR